MRKEYDHEKTDLIEAVGFKDNDELSSLVTKATDILKKRVSSPVRYDIPAYPDDVKRAIITFYAQLVFATLKAYADGKDLKEAISGGYFFVKSRALDAFLSIVTARSFCSEELCRLSKEGQVPVPRSGKSSEYIEILETAFDEFDIDVLASFAIKAFFVSKEEEKDLAKEISTALSSDVRVQAYIIDPETGEKKSIEDGELIHILKELIKEG